MNKNFFAQLEEKILAFWKKERIFERSVEERPENKNFVFYDGPPFATGLPHYGHILSSVIKDLVPRFWTMRGKRVRRRWGWDCHGLPVETLVEKKLGISGKKQIEEKGIELFNQTARSLVMEYVKQWKAMVDRIGRFVEFDNSYKTMDPTYMESVWWALKSLWDKDLIYEGKKVLLYCPRCETPVSNAEVAMDQSYKDITEDSILVKFKVINPQDYNWPPNTYFLAWTTTPWTLPGNVALAVGGEIDYALIKVSGEHLILAKDRLKSMIKEDFELIKEFKGEKLLGISYEPAYEVKKVKDSPQRKWFLTEADFVTTEEGTGIVHTAVMYGEEDFVLGEKIGLPQVQLLESTGRYNSSAPEFLQGVFIKDAESGIIDDLKKRNLLYRRASHTHSYPHCWRCESPLIYNAIPAWFVDIQKNKKKLIELNEKINWYPENLKHGRFLNILESAPDWNISRNRYWATPLPFWKCEKCGQFECVGSIKELKDKAVNFSDVYSSSPNNQIDLHRPYIDKIKLKCGCSSEMKRISEVVDCWVESSSMPFAERHYPFENKEAFENGFPGQFIGEYVAQTRTWFYYMHVLGVLLFDNISFENVAVTGTILNEKGEKLSKSKGNFKDPWIIIDQYGADALRFYLMKSVVMQADNLFFNEKDLRDVYNKVINLTYNIVNFLKMNVWEEAVRTDGRLKTSDFSILDRWILSRLNNTIKEATSNLENYNTPKYARALEDFISDLSCWWLRRSRTRFREKQKDAYAVLNYVLKNFAALCAPVTPFLAENIWQAIKSEKDPLSVHLALWPKAEEEMIDEKIEKDMWLAREIVELGHSLRASENIKVRQPLSQIYWSEKFVTGENSFQNLILEELNVETFGQKEKMGKPVGAKKNNLEVVLDVEIGEKLREVGVVRDIIRAFQDRRKRAGLKQGEQIDGLYDTEVEEIERVIKNNIEEIKTSSSLKDLKKVKSKDEAGSLAAVKTYLGEVLISIK